MSDVYQISHTNPARVDVAARCVAEIKRRLIAGEDVTVKLAPHVRSLDQNAKLWPMLTDFAKQVPWPVNGSMQLIEPEDWKAILTAAFEQEGRMAPGLRGGFVMLGARTSKYSKRKFSDLIEFLYAEGSERGVEWSERSKETVDRFGPQGRRAA